MIFYFLLIILVLYQEGKVHGEKEYGIVIDAGSSGSRAHLYSWNKKANAGSTPAVKEVGESCRKKPGISSYADNPKEVSKSIIECLNKLPISKKSDAVKKQTKLYLGATAGMRVLKHKSSKKAEAIFSQLRKDLKKLNYDIPNPKKDIRTISGSEEALGAWVSVNYIGDKFGKTGKDGKHFVPKPVPGSKTLAVLDLGGASTQISFVPSKSATTAAFSAHMNKVKLFGENYNVFARSFLCFGANEALKRLLALVLSEANFADKVKNPCFQKGTKVSVTSEYIFSTVCNTGSFAKSQMGSEIAEPKSLKGKTVEFIGTGNDESCKALTKKMINSAPILKGKNLVPDLTSAEFIAVSAFYYTAKGLKLNEQNSYKEFKEAKTKNCGTKTVSNVKLGDNYEMENCFKGNYVFNLLKKYGFNQKNWNKLMFTKKVNGMSADWALGFMLINS